MCYPNKGLKYILLNDINNSFILKFSFFWSFGLSFLRPFGLCKNLIEHLYLNMCLCEPLEWHCDLDYNNFVLFKSYFHYEFVTYKFFSYVTVFSYIMLEKCGKVCDKALQQRKRHES